MQDADGSLLVIDTGGWFFQRCPTSRIARPEVLGAIYPVRKIDDTPVEDARGLPLARCITRRGNSLLELESVKARVLKIEPQFDRLPG